jgi:sulfate-transporting ATPase
MVVSHDRWFLDRIATHILAFEEEGPEWFDGNYSEYETFRRNKLGNDARPKRSKFKKSGG